MKARGKTGIRVIAQGGDGGTTDIGLGCLSGMFERNDDVLYICYDNEAYMNTGVQRSSATPPMARTATTPTLGSGRGSSPDIGKSVPLIAMAHQIPFVATASLAHLATSKEDLAGRRYPRRSIRTYSFAMSFGLGNRIKPDDSPRTPCGAVGVISAVRSQGWRGRRQDNDGPRVPR